MITLRPVSKELRFLTYPLGSPDRKPSSPQFKALKADLDKRSKNFKSAKGNGSSYWLENCFWDERHSEDAVRKANLIRILQFSAKAGRPLLPEQAEMLLDELRTMAKAAGAAKWVPNRDKKIFSQEIIRKWWESRSLAMIDGVDSFSGGKLREKMIVAGLPSESINMAIDLRRHYAAEVRTTRYMELENNDYLQYQVKSELASLRARLVAGTLDLDGPAFHSLCLDRMDALSIEQQKDSKGRSAFLKGCMYDIADRCLLRFEKPVP